MANHGWVITKKPITFEQLRKDIVSLNHRVFKDSFKTEFYPKDKGFALFWKGEEIVNSWMDSARKIEFRHHPQKLAWWVEYQIQAFLMRKYKGHGTDEGVDGTWVYRASKYPDLKTYLEKTCGFGSTPAFLVRLIAHWGRKDAPPALWEKSKKRKS